MAVGTHTASLPLPLHPTCLRVPCLPIFAFSDLRTGGGIRLDVIWQILYIIVAVMIAFIIPFAFFFYENDVDEDAEANGFFETQTGGAIKYTLLVAIVFCVLL